MTLAIALVSGAPLRATPVASASMRTDAAGGDLWSWPVEAAQAVLRPYSAPPTPYGAGHRGIDVHAPAGAFALAPDGGVVHFAGWVVDRPVLSIRHADGLLSSFEPVETELAAGERVARGQRLGAVQEGHCEVEACMHFGVRLHGEYVSPMLLLGGMPRSVLLPTRVAP